MCEVPDSRRFQARPEQRCEFHPPSKGPSCVFVKIISLPAPRGVFNKCSRIDVPMCGGNASRTDAEPKHMADGKLEKETKRLIYSDCVIKEHEPKSWSWLARQSRSPQIKLWLSPFAGPPSLCFLCRAGLNICRKTRPVPAGSVWGFHHGLDGFAREL